MTLKNTKLRDAIAFAIVASAASVAGTGVAFAQEDVSSETNSEDATTLDRIEVTGSRLKRADIEGSVPVVVLDRETIEASGEMSVADYLRSTNFSSTGQFRPQSGSSAQAGAFADLRGLGSQRTLVLIDGHRAPKAPYSGQAQDLNTIPLGAVERIEVLTDGASAIYGADAVGGVINIITRKDYNGAEVTYGRATPEWGPTEEASALFGISGERGRLLGGFSHNRRGMIYTRDRPWGQQLGSSTYSNQYTSVDPETGELVEFRVAVPGGCEGLNFYTNPNTGRCDYNFNAVAADEASMNQKSFFMNAEYDINDNWTTYLRTAVNKVSSFGRYAPTPGLVIIPPDAEANPSPGNLTYLYHRFAAAGNRDNNVDGDVYDINLGFNGLIGESNDVKFGVRYNTFKTNDVGRNYIVGSLAEQAIVDGRYNIYDPYATPVQVLNSIKATIYRNSEFTTKEAYGSFAFNDLFEVGGGSAGLVVGAEYREEDYLDQYDSLSEAGVILGSSGNSAGGGRTVSAVYGEFLLPVTSMLELNFAARWEDYSDYGDNIAPKVSVRFQPLDSLTLRASWNKGFVAPTLDIKTQLTAFSADTVFDPATCLFMGDYDPNDLDGFATPEAYCAATGGLGGIQVDSFREAATDLGPEKSSQWQVGVVWDPADWLSLSADYYNIEITDRIAFYSSQLLIDIDNGDDPRPFPGSPCSLERNPNFATSLGNALSEIHNCYYNEGKVETSGVDFTATTNFDFGASGKLENRLMVTYVNEYKTDGGEDIVKVTQGFPQIRATLDNQWSLGDLDLGWAVRHIGKNGTDNTVVTPSWTTHDLRASYDLPWNGTISIGVNNVGDKLPELISYDGRPFNFYLYDAYGRTPYFRYTQRF